MDPVNKKEITSSFIQFIVMFLITVVLAIICVFFDVNFSQESYKKLRTDYNALKKISDNDYIPSLVGLLDSTQRRIKTIDVNDETNFMAESRVIDEQYLDQLKAEYKDTTDVAKLKSRIREICKDWVLDKNRLRDIKVLEADLKKKTEKISDLKDLLKSSGVKEDVINEMVK